MHAVLEGVTNTMIQYWLDTKYHSRRFYLGRRTSLVDQKLLRIKPPHEFKRTPRSVTTYKYWKASEFRAFLLYYALPVLMDILPLIMFIHNFRMRQMLPLIGQRIAASENSATTTFLRKFTVLFCFTDGVPIAVVDIFEQTCESPSSWLRNPSLNGLDGSQTKALNDFVFKVKLSVSNKTVAVPVSSILILYCTCFTIEQE